MWKIKSEAGKVPKMFQNAAKFYQINAKQNNKNAGYLFAMSTSRSSTFLRIFF